MTAPIDRPVIIGGGAAGLAACLTLEAAGMSPLLLESSGRLGGRLRTEVMPDGTPVDVGFQVLLTAYPELQRWVDVDALDPVRFVPGAKIRKGGRWRTLADPRRRPSLLLPTLTSGIGAWSDRWRILRMVSRVLRGPAERVQAQDIAGTTMDHLKSEGFSGGFIRDFLQPFFSGIFLDRRLSPPPAQFRYTLRMFAQGDVVRPKGGIEALVHQLQGRLERTEVRLVSPVASVEKGRVTLVSGEVVQAQSVICTVPTLLDAAGAPSWYGCLNAVFEVRDVPFGMPIIGLIPQADFVTNFHFMEDVQGGEGRGKLNATALWQEGQNLEASLASMHRDLRESGLDVGKCLWHAEIPRALPALGQVRTALDSSEVAPGLYIAGDATAAPSLDAALRSGRRAAEQLILQANRTKT